MDIDQISQTGRVAQGVRLINLKEENTVSNATLVQKDIVEEETNTNQFLFIYIKHNKMFHVKYISDK